MSTSATDCHVPSASRPATTGTMVNGATNAGSTCERPCPRDPCACCHRSSGGSRPARTASRSRSLAAPSSISATPAVACGTNTCSRPSPPPDAVRAKPAHSPVMSRTVSRPPVCTRMISVFIQYATLARRSGFPASCRPGGAPAGPGAKLRRLGLGLGRLPLGGRLGGCCLALLRRVLDDRVGTREHQAGMTVVEPDQVGRLTTRVTHLKDLPGPVGVPYDVPVHVQPVPDHSMHVPTSFTRFAGQHGRFTRPPHGSLFRSWLYPESHKQTVA